MRLGAHGLKGGARCCVSTCFEKGRDEAGSAAKKRNSFAGTVTPLVAQITACFSMAGSCALRPRCARSLAKGARMTTGQDKARPRDERKAGHLEISCTPSAPALQSAAAGGSYGKFAARSTHPRSTREALSHSRAGRRTSKDQRFVSFDDRKCSTHAVPRNFAGDLQRLGHYGVPALRRTERTAGGHRAGTRPSPHGVPQNFAS